MDIEADTEYPDDAYMKAILYYDFNDYRCRFCSSKLYFGLEAYFHVGNLKKGKKEEDAICKRCGGLHELMGTIFVI